MRILAALLCGAVISVSGLAFVRQPAPSTTPPQPPTRPAEVMVLGTFHFAGSTDAVQAAPRDILGDDAQAQIRDVAAALERFKPDRIFVEYPAAEQARLDTMYQDYLGGRRASSKNEIDQLGFRLAQRLGHKQVYAFDHPSDMDFPALMQCAQETGRPQLFEGFQARTGAITRWVNDLQAKATVGEYLAVLNDPRHDDGSQRLYMSLLEFDTADRQPALDLLTTWYTRNLKMHSTVRRTMQPGERALIIVGAAHTKHLRDFIRQDPSMKLADPAPLLPKPPARSLESLLGIETSGRLAPHAR